MSTWTRSTSQQKKLSPPYLPNTVKLSAHVLRKRLRSPYGRQAFCRGQEVPGNGFSIGIPPPGTTGVGFAAIFLTESGVQIRKWNRSTIRQTRFCPTWTIRVQAVRNEFQTRGLVLGHVQSGKTANYSALIAKSADLGYKLVIVLSGIDNGLRQQTQRRLNKELGLRRNEGVGEPEPGMRWIGLTNAELGGDFQPGTVGHNVLQGNEHVLAVIKKNATVLRRFIDWISEGAPPELPVLVVDDEADQASINTGGNRPLRDEGDPPQEEIEPSVINGLIRKLLRSFRRVGYVA